MSARKLPSLSALRAFEAAARICGGDLLSTIIFMNQIHPWLDGQTPLERAEQSDNGLEFVIDMIGAIEAVMKDTNWFSRTVVEKLANLRAPHGAARPVETSELTRREKEVLSLLCEGGDDAAIAKEMGVSRNTLRNHVARVYAKIGVNRRAQAILWARERGYPLQRPIR